MAAKRRSRKRFAIAASIVLAIMAALMFGLPRLRGPEVALATVSREPIVQTVVSSGRVMPAGEVELGVRATGSVLEVAVREGDTVRTGQLLVRLDDAEAQAAVAQALASVVYARAQLGRVRRVAAPLARESVARAELEAGLAERELARAEVLARAGAATEARLDETRQALALARSKRREAEVALSGAGAGGEEQRIALAALAQAEAALALADARLDQTRILAPVDGMVLTRDVEPGDLVQPGRPLLTLASLGPTRLVMEPDERNLAFLAVGQRAVASTEAFPDRRFDARVAFIAPAVDPDRGTIEVRLEVEGPPDYLRADMTVSIEVEVARSESGLVVPRRAVRESATDTPHILVFENGRAVERSVRVGLEGEERVELLEGADEGERVILDPGVAAGDRVRARREG